MESFILNLKFVAGSAEWQQDDPYFAESAVRACREAYAAGAWRVANVTVAQVFVPRTTPVPPVSLASPGFMVDALEVAAAVEGSLPVLGSLLGTWLQGGRDRKLRLRVGDIEAEAGSTREIERLLDRARALCADAETP